MILLSLFYFLPSVVCVFWFFIFLVKKKNLTQKLMLAIQGLGIVYFTAYALYISPATSYLWMSRLDAINEFCCPALIGLCILYAHAHIRHKLMSMYISQWLFLPAIFQGIASLIIYSVVGFSKAAGYLSVRDNFLQGGTTMQGMGNMPPQYDTELYRAFDYLTITQLFVLIAILVVALFLMSGYVLKRGGFSISEPFEFFFKGQRVRFCNILAWVLIFVYLSVAPLVVCGRTFVLYHPYIGILMSVTVAFFGFLLCYVETFSHNRMIALKDFFDSDFQGNDRVSNIEDKKAKVANQMGMSDIDDSSKSAALARKLAQALEVDQVYLNPNISLETFASQLDSNRTTLSNTINRQFGMSFRELIGIYRVNAAKAYMLEHPKASQTEVAHASGFKDASALGHKFRDVEDLTPIVWLLKNSE